MMSESRWQSHSPVISRASYRAGWIIFNMGLSEQRSLLQFVRTDSLKRVDDDDDGSQLQPTSACNLRPILRQIGSSYSFLNCPRTSFISDKNGV